MGGCCVVLVAALGALSVAEAKAGKTKRLVDDDGAGGGVRRGHGAGQREERAAAPLPAPRARGHFPAPPYRHRVARRTVGRRVA